MEARNTPRHQYLLEQKHSNSPPALSSNQAIMIVITLNEWVIGAPSIGPD